MKFEQKKVKRRFNCPLITPLLRGSFKKSEKVMQTTTQTECILTKNIDSINENSTITDFAIENKLIQDHTNGRKKNICCTISVLICGIINMLLFILSLQYNYQEEFVKERMKMRSGFPPMELWRKPNVQILLSIYLFNITNYNEFLYSNHTKLHIEEIGPITYEQTIVQSNIKYNYNNSTMTYTTIRTGKFLPELNKNGILNETVYITNPILLGLAAYLNDKSFFKKVAFNLIATKDNPIIKRTVYDALWNNYVPVLDSLQTFLPFLIPRTNIGILENVFYPVERTFNVKIGPNVKVNEFFEINTYNGETRIPGYKNEKRNCSIDFINARDGTCYPPFMKKETTFNLWRDDLSRLYPFEFEKEIERSSFLAYKYTLKNETYERFDDPELDCFRGEGSINLPNGLIDSSKCAFDLPVAYSNPHYYAFTGPWENYVEGLKPNEENHSSYLIIEPKSGVPLEAMLRVQYNIPIPVLRGFNKRIQRFTNMIVPSFWAEYTIKETTAYIKFLTHLFLLLPVFQPILTLLFFIISLYCITFSIRRIIYFIKNSNNNSIIINKSNNNKLNKNLIISNDTMEKLKEAESFLS